MGILKFLIIAIIIAGAAYAGFIYGQIVLQKDSIELEIPVKQDVNFSINQEVVFPIQTSIMVPVNKTLYIKKTLPISSSVWIDTIIKVPMNISGNIIYVDVPIKTSVPVQTSFEINEPVSVTENILVPINQNFSIPLKTEITIPLDTVVKTKVPLPWSSKEKA